MKLPFTLLKAEDLTKTTHTGVMAEALRATPPKPTTSIVGNVVVNLNKGLQNFYAQRSTLEAQLAEMTERLRQTNVAIHVLELGITEAAEDPALTAEERDMAGRPAASFTPEMTEDLRQELFGEVRPPAMLKVKIDE